MKTALRRFRGLPVAALALFTCAAGARPLLVPPQNLAVPQLPGVPADDFLSPTYGRCRHRRGHSAGVAQLARSTRKTIASVASTSSNATPRVGGPTREFSPNNGLARRCSMARWPRYRSEDIKIFERGAAGWALTGTIAIELGDVFRVEDGSIYVRQEAFLPTCVPPYQEFRKVSGVWTQVATIGGQRCDSNQADVNDGRALIVHRPLDQSPYPQEPAEIFASSRPKWTPIGSIPQPPPTPPRVNFFGPRGTIRGDTVYIDRGYFYRNTGGAWVPAGRLVEPEIELAPQFLRRQTARQPSLSSRPGTRLRAAKFRL